jgi:hypothetical protein
MKTTNKSAAISPQVFLQIAVWLAAVTLLLALPAGAAERSVPPLSVESRGYRVREYRWDSVLRQRWAVLEDSAHPERPYRSELADSSPTALPTASASPVQPAVYTPPVFVVRTGDTVTLWSEERNLRMQLAAVAESNAAIGDRIQLRVKGIGANGDWHATGLVRASGDVEMER